MSKISVALVVCGTLLFTPAWAQTTTSNCDYAGKTYSIGAFLCVAKNIGMVCGQPQVLTTTAPYKPGEKPISGSWQLVLQNSDLTHSNKGDACENNTGATPQ
jgi:hypothetical protein